MAKRTAPAKAAAAKPKKAATTLPKQFEAALQESSPDELRAYLRDLAARQRPIRADFLLYRSTSTGASDRASYLETIRLGLKQPPKAPPRGYYYDAPTAAEKRVRRFYEIAATLLRTANQYVTDRADLPAARAIGLALLEAELTELDPAAVRNSSPAVSDSIVQLIRDLWAALPASEARERLFAELLALPGHFGPPDAPTTLDVLELLLELAGSDADRLRASLSVIEALLARLPRPKAAEAVPKLFYSEDDMHELVRTNHWHSLLLLKIKTLGALGDPEAVVATLKAHADQPRLRTQGAELLLRLQRPAEARDLLREGLAQLPAKARGLGPERQWQQLLLQAERQVGDPAQVRAQARQMLVSSHYQNLEAYEALRATYAAAEWPAIRHTLLAEAEKRMQPFWPKEKLPERVALFELAWSTSDRDPARVMDLLEQIRSLPPVLEYEAVVWPTHADRAARLAEELLPVYIAEHNDRRELHAAAALMQRLARRPDARPRLQRLADELRGRYPRRTVLAEVLAAYGF